MLFTDPTAFVLLRMRLRAWGRPPDGGTARLCLSTRLSGADCKCSTGSYSGRSLLKQGRCFYLAREPQDNGNWLLKRLNQCPPQSSRGPPVTRHCWRGPGSPPAGVTR